MRQVKEALKSAEEANHAKRNCLQDSHDIRTPIGAILNLTELHGRTLMSRKSWRMI